MMFGWSCTQRLPWSAKTFGPRREVDYPSKLTYDFLENVDFVEEHAFFILVHVTLAEDFDGTMSSSLTVHAHADFTEGSLPNYFANSVEIAQFPLRLAHEVGCSHPCVRLVLNRHRLSQQVLSCDKSGFASEMWGDYLSTYFAPLMEPADFIISFISIA